MLVVPKKRAMEPQSEDEHNGRDAAMARGGMTYAKVAAASKKTHPRL